VLAERLWPGSSIPPPAGVEPAVPSAGTH
jgi:hypothetical protein